jgi:DNA-binding NarL/FixJ family response regulator
VSAPRVCRGPRRAWDVWRETPGTWEALAQARDLQPQVILIGLDKPGLETISRLRKVLPGVGIIALTLLEGKDYRQAALAAGADDLVCKAELITDLLPATLCANIGETTLLQKLV